MAMLKDEITQPAVHTQEDARVEVARLVPQAKEEARPSQASLPGGEGRAGAHPQVSQLLHPEPQERDSRHTRPLLQQDIHRRRLMRPPVLRPGIQHTGEAQRWSEEALFSNTARQETCLTGTLPATQSNVLKFDMYVHNGNIFIVCGAFCNLERK